MTDEELLGKVTHVWSQNSDHLHQRVLREHEKGFSKTAMKLDDKTKKWVTLSHRVFLCTEITNA